MIRKIISLTIRVLNRMDRYFSNSSMKEAKGQHQKAVEENPEPQEANQVPQNGIYKAFNFERLQGDRAPAGNFENHSVYAGDKTVIAETHFGCQLFLNLRNFDVVPSILKTGWWEPWNDKLLRSILSEKDTYINCGANFGYFTLLGSWCVGSEGRTISVEANPWIFDHLMKSILYSGMLDRSRVFNCAVGPTSGDELSMVFAPEWAGGGSVQFVENSKKKLRKIPLTAESLDAFAWPDTLSGRHNQGKGRMYKTSPYTELLHTTVPTMSLDELCHGEASEAKLIHMDIEGAEPGTILGGKELIAGSRDLFLIFEWSSMRHLGDAGREQAAAALNFLKDQGFSFYKIVPQGDVYRDFPDLQKMDHDALMTAEHCDIFCSRY